MNKGKLVCFAFFFLFFNLISSFGFEEWEWFFIRGLEHYEEGNLKNAEESFLQAVKLKPDSPEIYNNLGVVYKYLKEYEQAEQCYIKAGLTDLNFIDSRVNLCIYYAETENWKLFYSVIEELMKIDSANPNAFFGLALYYWKKKDLKQARKWLVLADKSERKNELQFDMELNWLKRKLKLK